MSGDVLINIGARDKASQVLTAVQSRVGALATSFSAAGPAILGVGAAIGGAVAAFVAVKSVIEGVVSAANTIDALADKANGLGESVANLQAFQFALGEAGNISGEKAISVLEKLSATVGGIASGQNQAGLEVFKQLGLDAEQLALEGPVAQFEAIQAKLQQIGNLSERAAVAQKIFGKNAHELMPALNASAESMRESAEYAKLVGATVKDEGVAAVSEMNDAVGRVGLGLQGLYNSVAVALAPAIENIAKTIADWLPPLVEMATSVIPAMVDSVAQLADAMYAVAVNLGIVTKGEKTWQEAIAASRAAAAERAAQMKADREAAAGVKVGALPGVDDGARGVENTIAALERQLAVLQSSEDFIKMQEQLATARNQAEYDLIEALQNQIMMRQAIADMDKEDAKRREEALRENERLNRNLTADNSPQQAVQGRLLTRGTGGDQIIQVAKQQLAVLQQVNNALKSIYEQEKNKTVPLTKVLVVP